MSVLISQQITVNETEQNVVHNVISYVTVQFVGIEMDKISNTVDSHQPAPS